MATTDYNYNATRNQLIERAFRIVGALTLGQTMSAEEVAQGNQALNDLIKDWQNKGVQLWALHLDSIPMVASTSSYALDLDPPVYDITRAYIREGTTDIEVPRMSWQNYQGIYDKSLTGKPTSFAIDTAIVPTLYPYPVPDASSTYTFYYLGTRKLADLETASGNAEFPARFTRALAYGLADDLADEYKLSISEREKLTQKAERLFSIAKRSQSDFEENEFIKGSYGN